MQSNLETGQRKRGINPRFPGLCGCIVFLLLVLYVELAAEGLVPPKSNPLLPIRSASRQFVVYGARRDLVSAIARRADTLADRWARFYRISASSTGPIIIRLSPSRLPGRLSFEINLFLGDDNRMRVQLDVLNWDKIGDLDFDSRIFQALTLRNAYSDFSGSVGDSYTQPPYWIIDAAIQDLLDATQGNTSRVYEAASVVAQKLDLGSFLAEKPRDSISQAIYRVKSRALVAALMELPRGLAGMHTLLSNPAVWNGTAVSLLNCFPDLKGDANLLSKIWLKNLTRPAVLQSNEPLRMAETAQRLNAVLFILLVETKPDTPFSKVLLLMARTPKYKNILREKAQELMLLGFRAHPAYQPLINNYREIFGILLQNPQKDLDDRIKKAEELRWSLNKRSGAIEDYINWFEVEALTDASNPFRSILENDQRRQVQPWRSDAISRTLDDVEAGSW